MKIIKKITGEAVPLCVATIYMREAYKGTIKFLPVDRQVNRMIGYNIGMLRELKNVSIEE